MMPIMKKTHILYDEKRLLFQEIVESIPDEVVAFFQKFESSRDRLTLTQEADVLNAVAHEEYLACASTSLAARSIPAMAKSKRTPTDSPRSPARSSRSRFCRTSGSRLRGTFRRRVSATVATGCAWRLRDISTNVLGAASGELWTGR